MTEIWGTMIGGVMIGGNSNIFLFLGYSRPSEGPKLSAILSASRKTVGDSLEGIENVGISSIVLILVFMVDVQLEGNLKIWGVMAGGMMTVVIAEGAIQKVV